MNITKNKKTATENPIERIEALQTVLQKNGVRHQVKYSWSARNLHWSKLPYDLPAHIRKEFPKLWLKIYQKTGVTICEVEK